MTDEITPPDPKRTYKLLIIEDDIFMRDIYTYTFKKAGFNVEEAVDGIDGVDMAESTKYDVILLDIMMPKKNGIEALRDMRQPNSPARDTPILLLTNLGQEEIVQEAFKIGANGYILKADQLPRQVCSKVIDFLEGRIKTEDFLRSQSVD